MQFSLKISSYYFLPRRNQNPGINKSEKILSFSNYFEKIERSFDKNLNLKIEKQIEQKDNCLHEYGFRLIQVAKDGDCFYHAVKLHLMKKKNYTVKNLRNLVADHILDQLNNHNNQEYRTAILAEKHTENSYINALRMGGNALWADNLQIIALMRILGRPIHIINNDATFREVGGIENEILNGDPIFVNYNRHNHYNGLTVLKQKPKNKYTII